MRIWDLVGREADDFLGNIRALPVSSPITSAEGDRFRGAERVWLSDVVLGNTERVLRACITSFRTDERDLDLLVSELSDSLSRLMESNGQ